MADRYSIGTVQGANRRLMDAYRQQLRHWMPMSFYKQIINYSDYSDSDTSEALNLNTTFTSNTFPTGVVPVYCWIQRITDFAGGSVSAATVIIGDTADPNGYLTSSDVFTGAKATAEISATPAAAFMPGGASAFTYESAFVPLVQLDTTGGNIDTLTAGKLLVGIAYMPLRSLPTGA